MHSKQKLFCVSTASKQLNAFIGRHYLQQQFTNAVLQGNPVKIVSGR